MKEIEFLSQISLFSDLSAAEIKKIDKISFTKEVPGDEILFFENESGEAIYLILSGIVKISKISASGREKTLAILESGDFFGEMSLLDGGTRSATAQVLQKARLLVIHRQDFLRVLHNYPGIASKIISVLSRRLRETNRQLENAYFKTVTEKVKDLLRKIGREKGEEVETGTLIEQRLTHQELANLVGASRESITRTLNDLQAEGWLEIKGKSLLIID